MVDDIATDADWNALYIDGERTKNENGGSIAIEDPSARETVAHIPRGTEADVDAVYKTAVEAQESWAEVPPARRQEIAEQFLQALNKYGDEIIGLLVHEVDDSRIVGGTSIQIASGHASETAALPRWMRGEHAASSIPGKENIVQKNPRGVVVVISPWNFPLNLSMRAVASAVATENTVVLKPSTNSPTTGGLLFAKLFEGTDLPEDVVDVVTGRGSEIGDRVAGHPESDAVTFTGSIEVGKRVSGIADEDLTMPAMEFDGNNAYAMTKDADVDRAADAAAFGSFVHQGRVRISINRHIVHESVYDEYVEKLIGRAAEPPAGSVHGGDTVVSPIIDESQRDEMLGYVEETAVAGAMLETGGSTAGLDGVGDSLVIQPTVLSGVTNDTAAARNEHFGPIVPIIPFSDVGKAVELADTTEYGLSGPIHAGDLATGKEITLRMETSNIHVSDQPINDETHVPFSGTGTSGIGAYNNGAFLDEITKDRWIPLQHEPHNYPL